MLSVCTRPSFPLREGPGDEASSKATIEQLLLTNSGGIFRDFILSISNLGSYQE